VDLDTGNVGKYLLLALAWAAYGAVHSGTISETATRFLKRRLGDAYRSYQRRVSMFVPVKWLGFRIAPER
jgi:protein-S-isoprenylcysteine O-methyltransferase Ste14